MDYETLQIRKEGHVLTAQLHRPQVRNAINMKMVHELSDLMDRLEDSTDIAVLVLRGSAEAFTCGIDLRDFAGALPREVHGLSKWEQMARQLENFNKFTVAAVQGECTGGGFQLLLLCDARLASTNATFRCDEVKRGFLPGMATFRLAKSVGLARAKNLILTGRAMSADEAHDWGLVDRVARPEDFEAVLHQVVEDLQPFHPVALQMARRLLNESFSNSYEEFLGHFLAAQHRAINSEAFNRLVEAALSEEK